MVKIAMFNIKRAITLKAGKEELRLMCSACHLMVFNIFVKFHERIQAVLKLWSGHKNCLHTEREREREREKKREREREREKREREREKTKTIDPIALHILYAGGITRVTVHMFCILSYGV